MKQGHLRLVEPAEAEMPVAEYGRSPRALRLPTYRSGASCPNCGAGQWSVGRVTAECGRCEAILPV